MSLSYKSFLAVCYNWRICSSGSPCDNNQCANGAVCVDGVNSYTCNCANTGYTGQFCTQGMCSSLHNVGLTFWHSFSTNLLRFDSACNKRRYMFIISFAISIFSNNFLLHQLHILTKVHLDYGSIFHLNQLLTTEIVGLCLYSLTLIV